jgi:hypothetical protein
MEEEYRGQMVGTIKGRNVEEELVKATRQRRRCQKPEQWQQPMVIKRTPGEGCVVSGCHDDRGQEIGGEFNGSRGQLKVNM